MAPGNAGGRQTLGQLQAILDRFDISFADAQDLVVLEDYEIVCIVDDSSSMHTVQTPVGERSLSKPSRTRWEELKETLSLIVELGNCFDQSGVDLFFLNRGTLEGVKGPQDPRFAASFQKPARGNTPLTETVRRVAKEAGGERPVLLFILTDGKPNGRVEAFKREIKRLIKKKSTPKEFRVQIMACTNDENAIGWLNEFDAKYRSVDVTDDYFSEMLEVLKGAQRVKKFTRGDWCMKAMLGMVHEKFDRLDEKGEPPLMDTDSDDEQCGAACVIS